MAAFLKHRKTPAHRGITTAAWDYNARGLVPVWMIVTWHVDFRRHKRGLSRAEKVNRRNEGRRATVSVGAYYNPLAWARRQIIISM